jgi:hypothetical protein
MPAEVLVGAKVLVKMFCHDPGEPAEQAAEAVVTTPEPFSSRQRETVRLFKVRSLVIVTRPFSLVAPKTPSVVLGEAVPMPTLFSTPLITKTSVLNTAESEKVEVEVVIESSVDPPAAKSRVLAADRNSPVSGSWPKAKAGAAAPPSPM